MPIVTIRIALRACSGEKQGSRQKTLTIEPTVRDLKTRIDPRLVAPGHCTGWRAKASLANTFAPGRYAPSVVGTMYRLGRV